MPEKAQPLTQSLPSKTNETFFKVRNHHLTLYISQVCFHQTSLVLGLLPSSSEALKEPVGDVSSRKMQV